MFSGSEEDFAIVMLVEELSNSDIKFLRCKFGHNIFLGEGSSWSDEERILYVLLGVVGVGDKSRVLRLIHMLEKYLKYKRRGVVYNFSKYKRVILELDND